MSSQQFPTAVPISLAASTTVVGSFWTGSLSTSAGQAAGRSLRIAVWLASALLAAAPAHAFAAQRGTQPSRPQAQPSRPQAQPSRPQAQPSRPQPQAQPTRPQPQAQPSRPQPQAQPSRPQPQAQPSRPQPSRPQAQPSRPQPQAPSPSSSGLESPRAGTAPGASRGWTPSPSPSAAPAAPGASQRSPGNVIDFGAGARPPRRTTPLLETRNSTRPGSTAGAERTAPGEGPSSAWRGRLAAGEATVGDAGLENARRAAAARSTSVVRERTLNRSDILQRYRGAAASTGADGQPRSAAAGAAPDANAARIAAARRSAAAAGAAGAGTPQRTAPGADDVRTRSATPPTDPESVAARVAAGRKDYLASLEARTADARRGAGGVAHVGAEPAVTTAPYGGGHYSSGTRHNGYIHHGWGFHYGHTFWNHWGRHCGFPGSWWLSGPFFACGFWWNSYWHCGGFWNPWFHPRFYWFGPFLPFSTAVIVRSVPEVVFVESEPEVVYVDAPAGEAVVPPAETSPAGTLNRAADYYLSLGDRAFREGRYGDAVHYYAKAIEFSPDDGILHLVLADALFATGDYRYAAYALRTAFEKDPALAANVVDKRSFYANPADFDAQLALLERYLEDHFLDDDARLVLAANYLFGGQPIDAVKLLESPFSESLRATPAGTLMLDVARELKNRPPVR